MRKFLFDFCHGDLAMPVSENMAINSKGDLLMKVGDHLSMDLSTGDLHMTSRWSEKNEDDNNDPFGDLW